MILSGEFAEHLFPNACGLWLPTSTLDLTWIVLLHSRMEMEKAKALPKLPAVSPLSPRRLSLPLLDKTSTNNK
jgi:hypothetical protein